MRGLFGEPACRGGEADACAHRIDGGDEAQGREREVATLAGSPQRDAGGWADELLRRIRVEEGDILAGSTSLVAEEASDRALPGIGRPEQEHPPHRTGGEPSGRLGPVRRDVDPGVSVVV